MPDLPARMSAHAASTPMPTGATMPIPVTTTRRRDMAGNTRGRRLSAPGCCAARGSARRRSAAARCSGLLFHVRADEIDRLLDGGDLLGFLVRDLGLEFFLEGHDQFDRVERIGAQIVDERRFILDLGL